MGESSANIEPGDISQPPIHRILDIVFGRL